MEDVLTVEGGFAVEAIGFGEEVEGVWEGGGIGLGCCRVMGEDGLNLGTGPEVGETFVGVGFGVEGGVEGAFWGGHFAEDEVADAAGDAGVAGDLGPAEGFGVEPGEHGVVVEHDFEVGDEPTVIGGVAMEGAGEVVVDAAVGEGVEGMEGHAVGSGLRIAARRLGGGDIVNGGLRAGEKEFQEGLAGEFGRGAEAAVEGVVVGRGALDEGVDEGLVDGEGLVGRFGV